MIFIDAVTGTLGTSLLGGGGGGEIQYLIYTLFTYVISLFHLQVSIVEPPQLGYDLNVQGGDVTFLPGLEAYLNSFIRCVLISG